MGASFSRGGLDARDLSFRDDYVQRAGVRTVHRASGANRFGHAKIITIVFPGCTSIHDEFGDAI
jgi:hypothetical protein